MSPKPSSGALSASPSPDTRLRDLRRMRTLATALLALMCAIFVATYIIKAEWPGLAYLRAFAEAGMIGACADWFAVVAMFRHPLGLPIPHTAIVPHNKERIGGAIGRFVSNNFLSPKVLTGKNQGNRYGRMGGALAIGAGERQPRRSPCGDVAT